MPQTITLDQLATLAGAVHTDIDDSASFPEDPLWQVEISLGRHRMVLKRPIRAASKVVAEGLALRHFGHSSAHAHCDRVPRQQ